MAREELSDERQHRLVTELAELFPRQKEWTEEDYFALPDTNRYVELSEGRLIMPPHPTYEVYILREGAYTLLGKYGSGQAAGSDILLGFTLCVDEVFFRLQ